jgi:hypothetical protein
VKEYLATLDDAAFGAASDVTQKFVSPSDPAAQWTGAMRGPAFFAYADNYLIDVKFGVIMDVEASRAIRQAEVGAAKARGSVAEIAEFRSPLVSKRPVTAFSCEFSPSATDELPLSRRCSGRAPPPDPGIESHRGGPAPAPLPAPLASGCASRGRAQW